MSKPLAISIACSMLLFCVAWGNASEPAHPNHVSSAEVDFNPKSGNFEVALCVWPTDLEKALARDQGKSIDLDKIDNLDALFKTYIEKRFLVRPRTKPVAVGETVGDEKTISDPTIRWVGHERDLKTAWLYFEIQCDNKNKDWSIENRTFFELNEDQLNQLELTIGSKSEFVVCRLGDSKFEIDTDTKNQPRVLTLGR